MRKRVLGRGLEALISQDLRESVSETERVMELEISRIDPNPHQPRGRFNQENLVELSQSIKRSGVLQPIVVRRAGERYQVVVGERRFRASEMAGKTSVPAIVRDVTDDQTLRYALMENLLREDLNPVDEARGYRELRDEFGLSVSEIAEMLGRDRSTIANTIRLLRLPGKVIEFLEEGRLTAGHGRAILSIEGEDAQVAWAKKVLEEGITVRDVERDRRGKPASTRRRHRKRIDPQIRELENSLEMHLGTRVRITPRRRGGVLSIEYYSEEELERIIERIGLEITS